MPKFMMQARFSPEAVQGILANGGSARRAALEKTFETAGGRLECLYYTFGAQDAFVICDLPDNATAAAMAMTVGASGTVALTTTVLLEPAEIDRAAGIPVDYRPPGS